jgi:Helicase conserved C-terminal domain
VALVDELRSLTELELAELFFRRPELGDPSPANFDDLATRASAPYSITGCLSQLTAPMHQVIEALVYLGEPSSARDIANLAGEPTDIKELVSLLNEARCLGLIFRSIIDAKKPELSLWALTPALRRQIPSPFALRQPLARVLERYSVPDLRSIVGNLGLQESMLPKQRLIAQIVDELSDPVKVSAIVDHLPSDSEAFLMTVNDAGGIVGLETSPYAREQFPDGLRWLFGLALLVPLDWETVILPREITIALRGGTPLKRFLLKPPEPEVLQGSALATRRSGVMEFGPPSLLEALSSICHTTEREPIAPLRTDGMAVKDVRNFAKQLGTDDATSARLIELCGVLGLLSIDFKTNRITPTPAFDEWTQLEPVDRWLQVVRAWTTYRTSLSRVTSAESKVAPLSPMYSAEDNAVWRRGLVMRALLAAPVGEALNPDGITTAARWQAPGRWVDTPNPREAVDAILEEAALLGLVRGGALTAHGRLALASGASASTLVEAMAAVFPPTITTFTVQADLTALAPSELQSSIRAELAGCADIESLGAASLYRFTEASLRRAFDLGRSRDEIVAFLTEHAIPSVPQPLVYLVDDVARRYGRVVVGSINSYVRVSDEVLLAEIVRAKKTSKLGLRGIAPTVAVSTLLAPKLMKGLRDAGFLPVEEGPDGVVISAAPLSSRAGMRIDWNSRGRNQSTAIWDAALTDSVAAAASLESFGAKIVNAVQKLSATKPS